MMRLSCGGDEGSREAEYEKNEDCMTQRLKMNSANGNIGLTQTSTE